MNIGACNGMAPVWYQAIIWTNAHWLSLRRLGTNSVKFDQNVDVFIEETYFQNQRRQQDGA